MTGRTALVTGASSGFGREFARLFAADGFDVALVARTGAVLEELAQEIEVRHAVTAHVLPLDLARPSAPRELVSELTARRVRVDALVNSAGFNRFGPFVEGDERRILELLQVNMAALTHLTRLVLPGMIQRGWGRIVNLSSNAAFQPGPMMADYYASKAYVLSLSIALSEELRGTGVHVTALCPGPTSTGFQRAARMEDPRLVAGRELADVTEVAAWGYRQMKRGRAFAVQGARWRTLAFSTRFVPRTTAARIIAMAQRSLSG
ncbi:MAG TPA: SDR family oxidoreductase [Actinomycetota bacterium]|nr:SDR family oxidoreductase [Actinomycetota bacterium]